jgi:ribonuclease J
MTTITLLAGGRTIGGTQIIVEDEGARLLFDCGLAHSPATDPFAYVRRRAGRELSDLILAGITPFISGVYAPDALASLPPGVLSALPPADGAFAVALSHSHLDHSHLAGFVDRNVPVFASEPAARIVRLLGSTGRALGGVPESLQSPAGGSFSVGAMNVRLIPVDHDVGGACGMLIETSDGVIAYSGDVRLHGAHPDRTLGFAGAARAAGARVLILEGTRLAPAPEPGLSPPTPARFEADVAPAVAGALEAVPDRLGIILLTPENGERVESIAAAAAAGGRLLVLEPTALAFATAALGRPLRAPHAIYIGPAPPMPLEPAQPESGLANQGEEHSSAERAVAPADIARDPGRYLLQLSLEHFAGLLDIIGPGGGGVILACNGPPLGPYDPAWAHLEWWAATLGCQIADTGSTGHASPPDLALIAGHSGAPHIMSIHSRAPELLPVPAGRLIVPEPGRPYHLSRLP